MLPTSLTTNEIKNSSGVEVEFNRQENGPGARATFKEKNAAPARPHTLTVSHSETGQGLKLRRRSVVRFDKTVISGVDGITPVTVSAYAVLDHPIGASSTDAEAANVLAELMSFLSTTGAGTTVLFDCTGTGAAALKDGSL